MRKLRTVSGKYRMMRETLHRFLSVPTLNWFSVSQKNTREEVLLSKATPSREEVLSAGKRTDYLEETEVFIQTHINSWFD